MKLHNLFENVQKPDGEAVLAVLKSVPWQVTVDCTMYDKETSDSVLPYNIFGNTYGADDIERAIKMPANIVIQNISNIRIALNIKRSSWSKKEQYDALKSLYIPPKPTATSFHDEDEFSEPDDNRVFFEFSCYRAYKDNKPYNTIMVNAMVTIGYEDYTIITPAIRQFMVQQFTDIENKVKAVTGKLK